MCRFRFSVLHLKLECLHVVYGCRVLDTHQAVLVAESDTLHAKSFDIHDLLVRRDVAAVAHAASVLLDDFAARACRALRVPISWS